MKYEDYKTHLLTFPDALQVWVCDFRFDDYANKPIRHVTPQLVEVTDNALLPKFKKVYYADHHFRPVLNKGKIGAKIIAPYDNTGFRGYTGNSLNIFLTRLECEEFYKSQCLIAKAGLEKYRDELVGLLNSRVREVDVEIATAEEYIDANPS